MPALAMGAGACKSCLSAASDPGNTEKMHYAMLQTTAHSSPVDMRKLAVKALRR